MQSRKHIKTKLWQFELVENCLTRAFLNAIISLSTVNKIHDLDVWPEQKTQYTDHYRMVLCKYIILIYFESVFSDVPRVVSRLFTLNK